MKKFHRTKKMFNQGAFVPGTTGGGYHLGGAVGKNTQPNYGGFVGGMTRGYADGGEVDDQPQTNLVDPADEAQQQAKQAAIQRLMNPPKLSEDDFTQPGEPIPKEGGLLNFGKYNLAHRNPTEDAMSMGMGMGGLEQTGAKIIPKLIEGAEEVTAKVSPKIQQLAEDYAKSKGLSINHGMDAEVDPKVGMKIAQAYEEMPHDPHNPEVKSAYDALKNETLDQYQAIKNSGLKAEPITSDMKNPYSSSQDVFNDIHNNNHLWYFPTEHGFGTLSKTADHPMLTPTNEKINGKPLLANDVFRIVHDYFGHAKEGNGFGPKGEENAWLQHKQMYSPEAQKAMTTETRGQNSWVNFGPHGIENQARPESTIYADQKAGILPEWAQVKNTPADLSKLSDEERQSMQDALDRLKGTVKSYGAYPSVRPNYSIPLEQAMQNYNRKIPGGR